MHICNQATQEAWSKKVLSLKLTISKKKKKSNKNKANNQKNPNQSTLWILEYYVNSVTLIQTDMVSL